MYMDRGLGKKSHWEGWNSGKLKERESFFLFLTALALYWYNKWTFIIFINPTALDGELAVLCNLQSATAGLNSSKRCRSFEVCHRKVVLTVGPFAIGTCEPCQVRKEAAVRKTSYVPEDSLTWANSLRNVWKPMINERCAVRFVNMEENSVDILQSFFYLRKQNRAIVR